MAPEVPISKRGGGLQEREDRSRVDWSTPYDEWLVPTLNRFRYGGAIECRAIPSEIQLNIEALIRNEKLKLLDEVRERVLGEDRLLMTMRPPILKVDPSSGRSGDEIEYLTEMNTRLDNDHAQYNRVYAQSQLQAEQRTNLTKLEAEL